jgi:DnaJ-class molecular chaperone
MRVSPGDDYYELLGVDAAADDAALRAAWRQLAARWHPDRAGAAATERFQRISAAYEVLSDPVARAAYDRRCGKRVVPPSAPKPAAAGRRSAPAVMLSRVCGSINLLLMSGALRLDEPGYITLVLRPGEAGQGGMATISMQVELWCPECAAKRRPATGCARCRGTRVVEELFSAWLAVPPGVEDGEVLTPTVDLPGMVEPVRFRVRINGVTSSPHSRSD